MGVLGVGGAFVQYAQPLGSGSRPSWSRLTWADSRRGRRRTLTTGTLRRLRARERWGGPVREAPGCAARTPDSLLRGPVSTALTLTSLPPKHPAEIVGILRIFSGVWRRYTFNVSTMDTSDLPVLFPRLNRLQDHQPAQGSLPSGCLRSEETAQYAHPSANSAPLSCSVRPLLLDDGGWEPDTEGGPVVLGRGGGVDVDAPAVGLDDGQCDRHAQACRTGAPLT